MHQFIKPEGPTPATIMLVGDYATERDTYEGVPFSGPAGHNFASMLQEAGILLTSCYRTTVIKERGNDESFFPQRKKDIRPDHITHLGKQCDPSLIPAIQALEREIAAVNPTLIIACGNLACWVLTGKWGVGKWRGSCLTTVRSFPTGVLGETTPRKVIPTYTPNQVSAQWCWRPIVVRDLKRAAIESRSATYNVPAYNFIIRPTYAQVIKVLDMLDGRVASGPTTLSVDVETRAGYIACTGIAWSKTDAICIPWMVRDNPEGYWTLDEEAEISWRLYRLLSHPNALVIGQNFIYDTQYMYRHNFFIPNFARDTMLAQHVCFATMPKGLDYISSMYAAYYIYWKDEGKEWDPKNYATEDEFWHYNCKDTTYTYEDDEVLQHLVDALGFRGPHDFQMSMFYPVLRAMLRGVKIDMEARANMRAGLEAERDEIQTWINTVLGHPINLGSPAQIAKLFYTDLGINPIKQRKTGNTTTDDHALTKLGERDAALRPLTSRILAWRGLSKLIDTYMEGKPGADNRMRCSYNVAGTDTFRLSSRKDAFGEGMNLQNQTHETKKMFVPDEGKTFFDIDLDSADLRIVVAESGETQMAEWLDNGIKPYIMVAREYYKDPTITKSIVNDKGETVDHPKYRIFKSLCHGTHYLGQAPGIAANLGLLVIEVERIQKWYFERFPRIRMWQERFKAQVQGKREVRNIFGYRLPVLDRIEGNVYNEAIAWLPQSTIGLVINKIWKNLHDNSPAIEVLLQTHDSLSGQFPTDQTDENIAELRRQAQIILPYPKPFIIPIGIKTSTKSWGDC